MSHTTEIQVIRNNYEQVLTNIQQQASLVGRNGAAIKLVVVTKGHPIERLRMVIEAGICELGENYVEEGVAKIQELNNLAGLKWHMIGHIQSRKVAEVIRNFDFIHTIDSVKLAYRLDRFSGEANRQIPALLECNTSGETTKYGFQIWDDSQWSNFLFAASEISALPHLNIVGLMTMAPFLPDPEETRPFFRRLNELSQRLNDNITGNKFKQLSMGMSSDYQIAVQEGATIVRVGQAILGARLN
jgi:hypothetical protein